MNHGHYSLYPLLLDQLERQLVRDIMPALKMKVPPKGDRSHVTTMQFMLSYNPKLIGGMDFIVMADEWNWLHHTERNVIFPTSPEILQKLFDARIDIQNVNCIVMPHDSYVLAMPKGYSINGFEIPSVLITWHGPEGRDAIINNVTKAVFGKPVERDRKASAQWDHEHMLTMIYRMPFRGTFADPHLAVDNIGTYRVSIPASWIPDLLSSQSAAEFLQHLTRHGRYSERYNDTLDLSEEDAAQQYAIFKLVIMLAIYAHNYPGALKPGFPGKEPKFMEPRLHGKWRKSTIEMSTDHSTRSGPEKTHYRSWFFRQLMAPRYYKGEHENKPVGSRVIFVRDTMVGREVTPEALE